MAIDELGTLPRQGAYGAKRQGRREVLTKQAYDRVKRKTRIWHLEIILLVAKLQSVSLAARELSTSVANVSKTITEFEKRLGRPIFDRENRKLTVLPEAERFVETLDLAMRTLDMLVTESGEN